MRKHIACRTTVAVEDVRTWPGVESVAGDQQRMQITANNAEDLVRRLLTADAELESLEVRRAGLSEAFTELTQEATQ